MITSRSPQAADWEQFYLLATTEGWKITDSERRLFQGPWSDAAQVLVVDNSFCGLVTAVAHQNSGWIGNLIVPALLRGQGYGQRLFAAALADLCGQGMTSVWLTASESGRPLYEKAGFVSVDRIERWIFPERNQASVTVDVSPVALDLLLAADKTAWGESRTCFLEQLARQGQVFAYGDAVALLQFGSGFQVLGPWYSVEQCPRSSHLLLQQLLAAADPEQVMVCDLVASFPLRAAIAAAGADCVGQTELMYYGDVSSIDLSLMVSLGSLGSIG